MEHILWLSVFNNKKVHVSNSCGLNEQKVIITGLNENLHSELYVNLLSPTEQRSRYFLDISKKCIPPIKWPNRLI
jgi:hypothetical protein